MKRKSTSIDVARNSRSEEEEEVSPSAVVEQNQINGEFGDTPPNKIALFANDKTTNRKRIFCDDVISESIQFLRLSDLLLLSETNRRILARPCRLSLERLNPPRFVGPLKIDLNGVHRERSDGQGIRRSFPFPQVPPSSDKILGVGRITINLQALFRPTNAHHLARISTFVNLCEKFLREHDLLLKRFVPNREIVERLAESIFSQLSGGLRTIETDVCWLGGAALLKSRAFLATNRFLFTDSMEEPLYSLRCDQFGSCVEWLHFPTANEEPRQLIFFARHSEIAFVNTFLPKIVERFERTENNVNNGRKPLPKFCVIVLFSNGASEWTLAPFHRTNGERGDALSLEPIHEGRDRFGRHISELFSMNFGGDRKSNWRFASTSCFAQSVRYGLPPPIGPVPSPSSPTPSYNPHFLFCGYILRRDVAIGHGSGPSFSRPDVDTPAPKNTNYSGSIGPLFVE